MDNLFALLCTHTDAYVQSHCHSSCLESKLSHFVCVISNVFSVLVHSIPVLSDIITPKQRPTEQNESVLKCAKRVMTLIDKVKVLVMLPERKSAGYVGQTASMRPWCDISRRVRFLVMMLCRVVPHCWQNGPKLLVTKPPQNGKHLPCEDEGQKKLYISFCFLLTR